MVAATSNSGVGYGNRRIKDGGGWVKEEAPYRITLAVAAERRLILGDISRLTLYITATCWVYGALSATEMARAIYAAVDTIVIAIRPLATRGISREKW